MQKTARALRAHGYVCAAILSMSAPALMAHHVGEELEADQQTVASSDQLIAALRQFERMPVAQRASMLQRLTQLAEQRRARMLALLERNPKLAALRVMPASVRERLPAQARALVEEEVTVRGSVVATIADDFARGRSQQRFELIDAAGQRLELRIANASERDLLALVGKRVSVAALRIDRQLLVLDKRRIQLAAADGTTTTNQTIAATPAAAIEGDQTTLVITANFTDKAVECGNADLQGRLFGSSGATLDQGYRQSSGGTVSFSGQVVGPYTINYPSTGSCDFNGWADALSAAAIAAGFNPSSYKRVSYVLPANANCGWSGLATIGGTSPTRSWIQACTSTGIFSHELGHNLKFQHASTPTMEYGDGSDPMGGAQLVQSNAANRVMAGWLGGNQVQDVATGGSYALSALESVATSPQVLRMFKADTAEYYYVSLRQPGGIDTNLASTYQNAITVHHATGTLPARTNLVATLTAGQSWTDSVNGIQVAHQALMNSTATVGINLTGPTCSRLAPTVAVAPSSQSALPGATLGYTLTLTNNNSAVCAPAGFTLAQALPAGFSGNLGASSVTLASGTSINVAWNVASATASVEAGYTLTALASDSAAGTAGNVHASYVVLAAPPPPPPPPPPADTTPPTLAITSPGATVSGRSATISATASDTSGVKMVEFYVDGTLLGSDTSAPYSLVWNLRRVSRGAHTVRVRAIDSVGNVAEQSIGVTMN